MNTRLVRLAERRQQLIATAAVQRSALALAAAPWRERLGVVDRGVVVFDYLRRRPALLVLGALVLLAWRPRRIARWVRRGMLVWQIGRRLRGG